MRLEDNYEENGYEEPSESKNVMQMAIYLSVVILFIVGIIVFIHSNTQNFKSTQNNKKTESTDSTLKKEANAVHESVQKLVENDGLTSDQLEFWDAYKKADGEHADNALEDSSNNSGKNKNTEGEDSKQIGSKETVTDAIADHVNQTMIKKSDGTEEWVSISPYITKNKYDLKGFSYENPIMKYYENSKNITYFGVDIAKENGDVNFTKLKNAGVQFVMIRVGARGYGNGQIVLDDTFADYMQRATEAGLNIGVYFYSQAISKEEALEEANLVYGCVKDYPITFPIAFVMEKISGDVARTDILTKEEKSNIALVFLQALKEVGYKGILYGNKEWLIQQINLSTVGAFDVWLSQDGNVPDYPYKFSMWQYTQSGKIDGIVGDANLDICFINYEMK